MLTVVIFRCFFFFKQKTAYEMRISDWSSDVCSSDLCRLLATVTEDTLAGVLRTGMGWWYPEADGPERGALDININGAMSYQGPWDPVTGSADTRYLPCRITRLSTTAAAE